MYDKVAIGAHVDVHIRAFFEYLSEKQLAKIRLEYLSKFTENVDKISLYPDAKQVIYNIKNFEENSV